MAQDGAKIRLHVASDLAEAAEVALGPDQSHYLLAVMRLVPGARLRLFNGRDGEWLARLDSPGRRGAVLVCERRLRAQASGPDLWLMFAPLKKVRTDYVVEKAVELGVSRVQPVLTRLTNAERVNVARLQAHATEAAEQCERLDVPEVAAPAALPTLLTAWAPGRRIAFCDETGAGAPMAQALTPGPWAILVGPEGGFAPAEQALLRGHAAAVPVGLGPRILRADTAAVAALALWQATLGDWA